MYNREVYLNQLIRKQNNGFIKIVSGSRRVGKTFLLFEIFYNYLIGDGVPSENIIRISLDDYKNAYLRDPDALIKYIDDRIISNSKTYILIDEIQLCNRFEEILNGFLHNKYLDVYVTGSNSKFLVTDIITEFRGRGDVIQVYPLTFSEYFANSKLEFSKALIEYIYYGGMPQVVLEEIEYDKKKILNNLVQITYLKDIVDRNNIPNPNVLYSLLEIISSSTGSLVSINKLVNSFNTMSNNNITNKTLRKYINHLKDAFLISEVNRYDVKGKRYISTLSKVYFNDLGIRNSILNYRQLEYNHLMENLIYNELLSRGYSVDIGIINVISSNHDTKQRAQYEIDFVCNQLDKRYYIQSVYRIDIFEKQRVEERSLLLTNDSFKKVIIVYDDIISSYNQHGIKMISLRDFLLSSSPLD